MENDAELRQKLNHFRKLCEEIAHLKSATYALNWDLETYMPRGAGAHRSKVIASLEARAHALNVSSEYERTVAALSEAAATGHLSELEAAAVRKAKRKFDRERTLPNDFVRESKETIAAAHHVWAQARAKSDFAAFLPALERIVALRRREAEYIGYAASPYDALIEEYEPGATVATLAPMLGALRDSLIPLLKRIMASSHRPDHTACRIAMPLHEQASMCKIVARKMGFDFDGGRLDASTHPFTSRLHPGDVRLTTRFNESDLLYGLSSLMHEAGHGMYEQGLPAEMHGTEAGEAPSLGIHESQSRLWENMVGKSAAFCDFLLTLVSDARNPEFHRALNIVQPSLIRTDADEVTYNLHICVRFEIERALIEGTLKPADVRDAWNAKYREYLGIEPGNDKEGVLQDVHWSFGYFGYFPTYAIGNLYSAQIFDAAERAIPSLDAQIRAGDFRPLKNWLQSNIYSRGGALEAAELVTEATGFATDPSYFTRYLERKYSAIYRL